MKKFLFKYLVVATLGAGVWESGAITKTYQWLMAPPPPPSREAQKLIASLEDGSGWEAMDGKDGPGTLMKGQVNVIAGDLWNCYRACIRVNRTEANGEFGWTDRRAIDSAARTCLRKVTARELDRIEVNAPVGTVTEKLHHYEVKLTNGTIYKLEK